jgi:hypothetical protein
MKVLFAIAITATMLATSASAENFANGDPRAFGGTSTTTPTITIGGGNAAVDWGALFGAQGRQARKTVQTQVAGAIALAVISDISGGVRDERLVKLQGRIQSEHYAQQHGYNMERDSAQARYQGYQAPGTQNCAGQIVQQNGASYCVSLIR